MAASSDSLVDFVENTEEDQESVFLKRRHQDLVRKLQSKKQAGAGYLCDQKKITSTLTHSSFLSAQVSRPIAALISPGLGSGMETENPDPQDSTLIKESSLVQDCSLHSYKTEMFCKDCRVLVCAICFLFGDHKGHSGADIEETRSGQ